MFILRELLFHLLILGHYLAQSVGCFSDEYILLFSDDVKLFYLIVYFMEVFFLHALLVGFVAIDDLFDLLILIRQSLFEDLDCICFFHVLGYFLLG
jgi:hypothetical protein